MWSENNKATIRNGLLSFQTSAAIRSVAGSVLAGLNYTYHENPRVFILEIIRVAQESDSKNESLRHNWTLGCCYKLLEAIKFAQG